MKINANKLIMVIISCPLIIVFIGLMYFSFFMEEKDVNLKDDVLSNRFNSKTDLKELSSFSSTIDVLDTYYLALNGKKTLEIKYDLKNNISENIDWMVENPDIVKIEGNTIYGLSVGTTNISGVLEDGYEKNYTIMVTDLIIPPTVNHDKEALPCGRYSEEEANLLDRILASRVAEGGKGSRGGVLAAARFITLEFPYLIKYFNENGRMAPERGNGGVDGEGRYYHEGLYLHESKFATLARRDNGTIQRATGPAIWGCPLYDIYVGRTKANGLTCSGFVTWAMINGGFDTGDVGAGDTSLTNELSDMGPHQEITLEYMQNNTYKVGDFIARDGHAAIIIGFDETTLYVAEELPRNEGTTNLDLNAYTYGRYDNYNRLEGHNMRGIVVDDNLTYVIEMSSIYPNGDGWTTDMWES